MQGQGNGHSENPSLTELRVKLNDGLARNKTMDRKDLPTRSGLGRTTVWGALQDGEPVPSAKTVAALSRALKLPIDELLALRRDAVEGGQRRALGRLITEWDPYALEVHPAGPGTITPGRGVPGAETLPGYVVRAHDRVLAEAVRDAAAGRSRMLALVGTSSTGKTRACWEAVQLLADKGWSLWHPFDPTRAQAALEDLHRVRPRTVVWLNEAQHYLDASGGFGERIAAAVHTLLLTPERAPVLVLGTLWPEYYSRYLALPNPSQPDPHSRTRELLAGRVVTVPDAFDDQALSDARASAVRGDQLLADALTRAASTGRLAQDLAGAPELLRRYEMGTSGARALLEAAMDARRLGAGIHLPRDFLIGAATDYLTATDYEQIDDDWAEVALAELAQLVHGKQAPLRRVALRESLKVPGAAPQSPSPPPVAGPVLRLADYLEQHGRTARRRWCPPSSFWHAAHTHLDQPDDLASLSHAAQVRHRLQWAHHLRLKAAAADSPDALLRLAELRARTGAREDAKTLYRRAADNGSPVALLRLAEIREEAGAQESTKPQSQNTADRESPDALLRLAIMRERAGDFDTAQTLYRRALWNSDFSPLLILAENSREPADAERLYRQALEKGSIEAVVRLAELRGEAGDWEEAESLAWAAADNSNIEALLVVAWMRERAGEHQAAETLYHQAADNGFSTYSVFEGATKPFEERWPYGLDPDGTPSPYWPR